MTKPFTEEELGRIWYKAVQLRPQHRDDMAQLIAIARDYKQAMELLAARPVQSAPGIGGFNPYTPTP